MNEYISWIQNGEITYRKIIIEKSKWNQESYEKYKTFQKYDYDTGKYLETSKKEIDIIRRKQKRLADYNQKEPTIKNENN